MTRDQALPVLEVAEQLRLSDHRSRQQRGDEHSSQQHERRTNGGQQHGKRVGLRVDSSSSSIWSLCGHCPAQHSWNTPPLDRRRHHDTCFPALPYRIYEATPDGCHSAWCIGRFPCIRDQACTVGNDSTPSHNRSLRPSGFARPFDYGALHIIHGCAAVELLKQTNPGHTFSAAKRNLPLDYPTAPGISPSTSRPHRSC